MAALRIALIPAAVLLVLCGTGWLLHGDNATEGETSGGGATVTVVDLAGRRVSLKQPVERIVLIRGRDIYPLALLLGKEIEEKLVAWGPDLELYDGDTYRKFLEHHPPLADVPKIGSVYHDAVSAEQVLTLRPDLVIVDTFMTDRGYKCIEQMDAAGLPLLFLSFSRNTFEDPQRSIEVLGRVLGKESRARQISSFIDGEFEKVFSRLPDADVSQPSIYVEAGYEGASKYGPTYGYGYDAQGRMSSWGATLDRLGCRNIAGGVVPDRGPIHPEHLLTSDPDVIVITGACWQSPADAMRLGYFTSAAEARDRLRAFALRPGWDGLTAIETGRVYGLYHNLSMQMTDFAGVQQLAQWLYPGRFDDLDPQARLAEFHKRFMTVDYSGVLIIGLSESRGGSVAGKGRAGAPPRDVSGVDSSH
ncbi:MAG: ABC transporter substrate-binding protein [Planctomycetota bacterium]